MCSKWQWSNPSGSGEQQQLIQRAKFYQSKICVIFAKMILYLIFHFHEQYNIAFLHLLFNQLKCLIGLSQTSLEGWMKNLFLSQLKLSSVINLVFLLCFKSSLVNLEIHQPEVQSDLLLYLPILSGVFYSTVSH